MKQSAGLLPYRINNAVEFLLVHPGGPFFRNKNDGFWTIPKGEFDDNEHPLAAAKREFLEETGFKIDGVFIELTPVVQKAGKKVYAWAIQFDADVEKLQSNRFSIEWPPKSGIKKEFPEVDKAGWFAVEEAKQKINEAQINLIDELLEFLKKGA